MADAGALERHNDLRWCEQGGIGVVEEDVRGNARVSLLKLDGAGRG